MEKLVTANTVADFFIWFAHQHGDCLTNKKLQKLVYYAQAWHLALHDQPLFNEPFEAWVFGPVQPTLYQRFKHYRWNPIDEQLLKPDLPPKVEKHLKDVFEAYGRFSAWDLERMVHEEDPWKNARKGLAADVSCNRELSQKDMQDFYKQSIGV